MKKHLLLVAWLSLACLIVPAIGQNRAIFSIIFATHGIVSSGLVNAADAGIVEPSAAGLTVDVNGRLQRAVYRVVVDRSAFVCADVTCDVTVATLPARTFLQAAVADLATPFACASTCTSATLSMQLGTGSGGAQLLESFDADAAAGVFGDADGEVGSSLTKAGLGAAWGTSFSWSGTQAIVLRLTSGTGDIGDGSVTHLSQGSVTLYLITERLP